MPNGIREKTIILSWEQPPCRLFPAIGILPVLILVLGAGLAVCAASEFPTPLDYGATGDGIADDSNALQQAVSQGQVCHLASRVYRITHRILYQRIQV